MEAPSNVVQLQDRLRVLTDRRTMESFARQRGIGADNDALRASKMGQTGTVIKIDGRDSTVKLCFGPEDVWFPVEVLEKVLDRKHHDPFTGAQRFHTFAHGGPMGPDTGRNSMSPDIVSEETYTQVVQGPNGTPLLKVITVRKRRDGTSENIIQTQPL